MTARAASGYLVFRADASARMGTGHIMRSLALAQAWIARGGEAAMVASCESAALCERIRSASVTLHPVSAAMPLADDVAATCAIASGVNAVAVVVDGYHFGEEYQLGVKASGARLAVFDDFMQTDHYHADWVINQNLGAESFDYICEGYTRLLLGAQYIILRPEFARWRNWTRPLAEKAQRILVTLGGSDPGNVTAKVIEAIAAIPVPGLETSVIVGAGNAQTAALEAAVGASTSIRLARDVTDMAERMAWADVALAAGGTTCWELAFMGVPSALVVLADNQAASVRTLAQRNAALDLGIGNALTADAIGAALRRLIDDTGMRAEYSRAGRTLVDGMGAERVVDALIASCEVAS